MRILNRKEKTPTGKEEKGLYASNTSQLQLPYTMKKGETRRGNEQIEPKRKERKTKKRKILRIKAQGEQDTI